MAACDSEYQCEPACLVYECEMWCRLITVTAGGPQKKITYLCFFVINLVFNLPVTGDESPMFPRKRKTAKCCGIVFCGPFGWETKMGIPCKGQENFI